MRYVVSLAVAVQLLSLSVSSWAAETPARIVISCDRDNDLFQVLRMTDGVVVERHASAVEAVQRAPRGAAVMILADGYPQQTTAVDAEIFKQAAAKELRLFVEYPAALPGIQVGRPTSTHLERAVIASDLFGDDLKKLRIVSINGLHYLPVWAQQSHIVAARVAGFDHAVYGLPKKTSPILFEMPQGNVLVATTSLSRFVTGRYAPQDSWRNIWAAILTWLAPEAVIPPLRWTPTVRATYTRDEKLPTDYEHQAIRRGVEWYKRAKMIIHPSFEKQVAGQNWVESLPDDAPPGDGTLGSMEAVLSVIHQDGSQRISSVQRGDCICETAMALAFGGSVLKSEADIQIARNLLDYYLLHSAARKRERGDPRHGAYGLIAWGITTPDWYKANYGDDNARQMMGTLATAALTGEDRWDEAMMMCLLANLRTTGQLGFRGSRIDIGGLADWKRYFRGRPVNYAPHFEAYLWACYLWAYEQTDAPLFLNRAETALCMTMDQYTDGWRWTNGLAQEKARIVLPLAWLVRAKDTPENRAMLRQAVDGLLALQDESGAIREELGLPGKGVYPPPGSNAAYGTNEASLIAKNGDPVADLLYTTNFAFLALHEAAAATGDEDIRRAEDKLAEFLCRIQVTSETQPAVDGGWFRAFDFGRWEHWGCNADHGWGAWAVESGWTQGWIVSVLAMRQKNTSLWDLTRGSKIQRHFPRLRKEMIPIETIKPQEPKTIKHAAMGKPVRLAVPPDPRYSGSGAASLGDGVVGVADHTAAQWLGFWGTDLEATVDLGAETDLYSIEAGFLQSTAVGIYLPAKVEYAVSSDGKEFRTVATVIPKVPADAPGPLLHRLTTDGLDVQGRYVRVVARNVRTIPAGHRSAGIKAWLFVDELLVNP
ncbi:MAG: discoidin domain-containing protein [Planctomycetes bacterium]|nr:discoidin domain-containing protein [Planctomycetota bacterium]